MVTSVTEESVVVSRVNFLAFVVEVLNGIKLTKIYSDIVRCVVQAVDRVLGIGEVDPAALHNKVFSRGRRDRGGREYEMNEDNEVI